MEDQTTDRKLRKLIQSEAMEKAPDGFSIRVMERLDQQPSPSLNTGPIISKRQWIVSVLFLSSVVVLSVLTKSELSGIAGQFLAELALEISPSKPFVLCLVVFTLFMSIQIYFIEKKIQRFYG